MVRIQVNSNGKVYSTSDGKVLASSNVQQVQSDWAQEDSSEVDYIKNKPTIPEAVTVDQSYDGTSANPQSGVAIEEAGFVKNTATGTNSLSILGAQNSSHDNTIAIGSMAAAGGSGISIGANAQNSSGGGVTIGNNASGSTLGVTIGPDSKGYGSNVVAIGQSARVGSVGSNANGAIMLGSGNNTEAHTFKVGLGEYQNGAYVTYNLLDSSGEVPSARYKTMVGADGINAGVKGVVPAPTATDNDKFLRGDGTWSTVLVPNQNTASGATNPLNLWEGTSAEYESGGGSQTWYNWQSLSGGLNFVASTQPLPNYGSWSSSFAYGNNLCVILQENEGDFQVCYSSDNGDTWTRGIYISSSEYLDGNCSNIVYGNGVFVVIGSYSGKVMYSADCINWTLATTLNSGKYRIIYANNEFYAVGGSEGSYSYATSPDGITWTEGSISGLNNSVTCLGYGNGKYIIGVGYNDDGRIPLYYSTNKVNYTQCSTNINYNLDTPYSIAYGNGMFIVALVGMGGYSFGVYSNDGIYWPGVVSIEDEDYYWPPINFGINFGWYDNLCYGSGLFVTSNGKYSTDGVTWLQTTSSSYTCIGYANNTFMSGNEYAAAPQMLSCFTTDSAPTTSSQVYSAPNTASALTITSVGTGTITLSDTNTYNYNASGNQTTSQTVGEAHPDWICMIEGVGIKKGTTTIANNLSVTVDQTYDASSTNAQSGVAVASGISDSLGTINTQLESIIAQGD